MIFWSLMKKKIIDIKDLENDCIKVSHGKKKHYKIELN